MKSKMGLQWRKRCRDNYRFWMTFFCSFLCSSFPWFLIFTIIYKSSKKQIGKYEEWIWEGGLWRRKNGLPCMYKYMMEMANEWRNRIKLCGGTMGFYHWARERDEHLGMYCYCIRREEYVSFRRMSGAYTA